MKPHSPNQNSLVITDLARTPGHPAVSLTVNPGECIAISGSSGAGKTTLLRLVADLDPGFGTARIGAFVREDVPAHDWRRKVVYVASDSGWWEPRVSDHMSNGEHVRSLLGELDMAERFLDEDPDRLSSGERQRLALVRALVLDPPFLLLDEPTSALDLAATRRVEALLLRFRQRGGGVLLVSHDAGQIGRIADRSFALSSSGIIEVAP